MKTLFIILLLFLPLYSSCEVCSTDTIVEDEDTVQIKLNDNNDDNDDGINDDIKPAIQYVRGLAEDNKFDDAFIFFTDPHLLSYDNIFEKNDRKHLEDSFMNACDVYSILSLDFCLCGGDWLNHGDTQEVAKSKLLFADSKMKSLFSHYFKIMGNHDTNYQGIVSSNDLSRGDLSRQFIDNVYYSETGAAYFSFMGESTRFYILDSGLDRLTVMNDYRWEQLLWLADSLQSNDNEHQVICIHMIYNNGKLTPMSEELFRICKAYNAKLIVNIDGVSYDYTSTKGKVHYILGGHNHQDVISFMEDGLPIIRTRNFMKDGIPSFDICLHNYSKGLLFLVRVGGGENRQVAL